MKINYQMRNGLGVLNIYLKLFWWSVLSILILGAAIALTWATIAMDSPRWFVIMPIMLWLVVSAVVFAYWDTVRDVWRDMLSGHTTRKGRVVRKRVEKEVKGYEHAVIETKYYIAVGVRWFRVSKKIHNWLSEGDTVVIHYWPRSETVARVEMMSRGSLTKGDIAPGERIKSSTSQYAIPKDVYFSLLSQLEAEGGFVTFQHKENENSWVQVLFFDKKTQVNFGYPYHEDPNRLISKQAISFPTGYALSEWEPQLNATFAGPRCSQSELANTIDELFTKLLGASPDYVVDGWIE